MFSFLPKTISKKIKISLFLFVCLGTYIVLRIFQGSQYVKPYFQRVFYLVSVERKLSYDKKMFDLMGLRYLYPRKIEENTPQNATICFWDNDALLDYTVAAYFVYPRTTKEITEKGKAALSEVNSKKCDYLVIHRNLPVFDMPVVKVLLFDDQYQSEPVVVNTNIYAHLASIYRDQIGLIQVK